MHIYRLLENSCNRNTLDHLLRRYTAVLNTCYDGNVCRNNAWRYVYTLLCSLQSKKYIFNKEIITRVCTRNYITSISTCMQNTRPTIEVCSKGCPFAIIKFSYSSQLGLDIQLFSAHDHSIIIQRGIDDCREKSLQT